MLEQHVNGKLAHTREEMVLYRLLVADLGAMEEFLSFSSDVLETEACL